MREQNKLLLTRRVLVEKKVISIKTVTQLSKFLTNELSSCDVYKYGVDTLFYIQKNFVLLEAQFYVNGYFYLNPLIFEGISLNIIDMERDTACVFIDYFHLEKNKCYTFHISSPSSFGFMIKYLTKIS